MLAFSGTGLFNWCMTHDIPSGEDPAKRILDQLQEARVDPAWASIVEEVEEAQERIDDIHPDDTESVDMLIGNLCESWSATNWDNTLVSVSGKLRLMDVGLREHAYIQAITNGLNEAEDEIGLYYEATGTSLLALRFLAHPRDDGDGYRVGLGFVTPDIDIVQDDGDFIMFPEDIIDIILPHQSNEAIEQQLKYHFPSIYNALLKHIPCDANFERSVVSGLKAFYVPDDSHVASTLPDIGKLLFNRIEFEREPYTIVADGPVRAMGVEDDIITTKVSPSQSFRGIICDIVMEDDGDPEGRYYRPSLVAAVYQQQQRAYCTYIVPAESLVSMRSSATKRRLFGEQALTSFADPKDIPTSYRSLLGYGQPEQGATHNIAFDELVAQIGDLTVKREYDFSLEHYEPVSDDIMSIIRAFTEHFHSAIPPDAHEQYVLHCAMQHSHGELSQLRAGDVVLVDGSATLIADDGEGGHEVSVLQLEASDRLYGEFDQSVAVIIPNLEIEEMDNAPAYLTQGDSVFAGIRLYNCVIPDGDEQLAYDKVTVVLPIKSVPTVMRYRSER